MVLPVGSDISSHVLTVGSRGSAVGGGGGGGRGGGGGGGAQLMRHLVEASLSKVLKSAFPSMRHVTSPSSA